MFLVRYVLKEYFLLSSLYNIAGYIIICVKLLIPIVVGEIILTKGIQFVSVRTLNQMDTYPQSVIIFVSVSIVLVVID